MPLGPSTTAPARPGWQRRLALAVLAILAAASLYAVVLALLWWRQEALLFHPRVLPANHRFDLPADVHEAWVEVPGARLHALHLQLPQPRGVVFFLHGNAGSLQTWFVNTEYYRHLNYDLFMLDYRGFGKSSGRIESEAQLHADVAAAWAQVAPRYAASIRVLLGRSLGTGLAVQLATSVQPELTVLVSAYESMTRLAHETYPWVPAAVLRYPLRTDLALPAVKGQVLLAHGLRDTLIPAAHSQALFGLARQATWLPVPAAGHGDMQEHPAYLEGLALALRNAAAAAPAPVAAVAAPR